MKRKLFITICFPFLVFSGQLAKGQANLNEANNAFNNLKLLEAKSLYKNIWNSSTTPLNDKIESGKKLAYINWHFFDDINKVERYYDTLSRIDNNKFNLLLDLGNYEKEAKNFDKAKEFILKAVHLAKTNNEIKSSKIKYADAVFNEAIQLIDAKQNINFKLINSCFKDVVYYSDIETENIELSRLLLGYSLLLKDSKKVLEAWKNYFRIPKNKNAEGILSKAESDLILGLQDWNSYKANISLIESLAHSRFYDFAVMMSKYLKNDNIEKNELVIDINNYYHFIQKVKKLTYDYYKALSKGIKADSVYLANIDNTNRDFWITTLAKDNSLVFNDENFNSELYKRFGTKTNSCKGTNDICFFAGHSIRDETRQIEQYGRKAEVRFFVLDNIFGNIYPHWYFGFFGVGGWATINHEILQIRNIYANMPVNTWYDLTDSARRKEWVRKISINKIKDDSIASINPTAFLTGLAERLKFKNYDHILDSLKSKGLTNNLLKMNFISTVESITITTSIFAHEGRHNLDSYKDYPLNKEMYSYEEREFRAKISEVPFSPYPFLTLAESILRQEPDNAHNSANQRIIEGVVIWMEAHKDEIKNFDNSRPVLPQLDLLTKSQLISAIREIDPLVKKEK